MRLDFKWYHANDFNRYFAKTPFGEYGVWPLSGVIYLNGQRVGHTRSDPFIFAQQDFNERLAKCKDS